MMKIVCLGDSLTFGYQMLVKEKWHVIVQEMADKVIGFLNDNLKQNSIKGIESEK